MLREDGEAPEIIDYLKTPPSRARLVELIGATGLPVRAVLRTKSEPYTELGIWRLAWPIWDGTRRVARFHDRAPRSDRTADRVTPKGVRLCRAKELVTEIL